MKSITKKLMVAGKDVNISSDIFEDQEYGVMVAEHTATVGSIIYKARETMAPNATMTQEEAQSAFDAFRQQVAEEAAGRENRKNLAAKLV